MNPKAQLMGTPGYIKQPSKVTRAKENRNWKREYEVARYRTS